MKIQYLQNTGKIKETKTGETRLFYFGENSRLKALLLEIKSPAKNDLVFLGRNGKSFQGGTTISCAWRGFSKTKTLAGGTEKTYLYPGIVSQLVRDGKISGYLSPYHTRHTYITHSTR